MKRQTGSGNVTWTKWALAALFSIFLSACADPANGIAENRNAGMHQPVRSALHLRFQVCLARSSFTSFTCKEVGNMDTPSIDDSLVGEGCSN